MEDILITTDYIVCWITVMAKKKRFPNPLRSTLQTQVPPQGPTPVSPHQGPTPVAPPQGPTPIAPHQGPTPVAPHQDPYF
ncbi:hypothetical protein QL285_066146 [Trifolium repens]|nr:hypothetical protein QL285_066146 [Trifolium repens]